MLFGCKANTNKVGNAKIALVNQTFCGLYYKTACSGTYNKVVSAGLLSQSVRNSIHCQLISSCWIIYFLFIVKYVFHISFRTHCSNLSLKTEWINYLWAILWNLLWWYFTDAIKWFFTLKHHSQVKSWNYFYFPDRKLNHKE